MSQETLHLYFESLYPPLLVKTHLRIHSVYGAIKETICRRDDISHPQEPHFRWKKGIKTLCLAVIRLKLGEIAPAGETVPLLSGRTGSAAATLDNLVHKADTMHWLQSMLLVEGESEVGRRLQGWFERQNSQGNNKNRPIRIFASVGSRALEAKNIKIWIGSEEVGESSLRELEKQIAENLGESISKNANSLSVFANTICLFWSVGELAAWM